VFVGVSFHTSILHTKCDICNFRRAKLSYKEKMSNRVYHIDPRSKRTLYGHPTDSDTPTSGAITVRGKLPKRGQPVRAINRAGEEFPARVHEVNAQGVPVRLQRFDTGKIIDALNLLIELVGVLGRLWFLLRGIFIRKPEKEG